MQGYVSGTIFEPMRFRLGTRPATCAMEYAARGLVRGREGGCLDAGQPLATFANLSLGDRLWPVPSLVFDFDRIEIGREFVRVAANRFHIVLAGGSLDRGAVETNDIEAVAAPFALEIVGDSRHRLKIDWFDRNAG